MKWVYFGLKKKKKKAFLLAAQFKLFVCSKHTAGLHYRHTSYAVGV